MTWVQDFYSAIKTNLRKTSSRPKAAGRSGEIPVFAFASLQVHSAKTVSDSVFVEAVADVGGKVLLDDAAEEAGQRGGDGDQDPDEGGEGHTHHGDGLERDGDGVGLGEADVQGENVGDELDAVDDDRCQQEGDDGERADQDEQDVDSAGDGLAAAAVGALDEVLLVVGAHGRGEAGDVVAPAGEDVAYDLIRAGGRMQAAFGGEGWG